MASPAPGSDLTKLLNRMFQGDRLAGDQAMDALYTSLRRIASARLRRERPGHLLDTKALIHEAMVRLFGTKAAVVVRNRQHFLALACLLMKRILIESGRRKDPVCVSLEESMAQMRPTDVDSTLEIERILDRFKILDPRGYRVLQLKVGAGMTSEEVAAELACSVPTVNRHFQQARAWMYKELSPLIELRN